MASYDWSVACSFLLSGTWNNDAFCNQWLIFKEMRIVPGTLLRAEDTVKDKTGQCHGSDLPRSLYLRRGGSLTGLAVPPPRTDHIHILLLYSGFLLLASPCHHLEGPRDAAPQHWSWQANNSLSLARTVQDYSKHWREKQGEKHRKWRIYTNILDYTDLASHHPGFSVLLPAPVTKESPRGLAQLLRPGSLTFDCLPLQGIPHLTTHYPDILIYLQ